MSSTIPNWFVTKYEREVAKKFSQTTSVLRTTVRTITGAAERFSVPTAGIIEATDDRPRYSPFTPGNTPRDKVEIVLKDVEAVDWFTDFDQWKVNADLQGDTTETLVGAVNRKLDSYIIAALNTSSATELSISNTLNANGLIAAQKALNLNDVPMEDRYAVVSAGGYEDIMADNKLTSRDYVADQIMKTGTLTFVQGFHIKQSNLLPDGTGASQTRCFFYHKKAVVLAIGKELSVKIDWRADIGAYQVLARMSANAALVRPEGVTRASIAD